MMETEISGGSDWAEKDVGSFRTCIEQQQRSGQPSRDHTDDQQNNV